MNFLAQLDFWTLHHIPEIAIVLNLLFLVMIAAFALFHKGEKGGSDGF